MSRHSLWLIPVRSIRMAKVKDGSNRSFVLRIDSEIMEALERWAADEFRSTNAQLQWIISEALKKSGRIAK